MAGRLINQEPFTLLEVIVMNSVKHQMLAVIQARAECEARILAAEFARAAAEDRDAILAGVEFEQWLAESCGDLVRVAESGHRRRF